MGTAVERYALRSAVVGLSGYRHGRIKGCLYRIVKFLVLIVLKRYVYLSCRQ